MAKKIKMAIYAEPGVGKSTFASKAPNPFFICTDGNYDWLDRPEEDHVEVPTWEHAKKVFADIEAGKYAKYDTIVVDLLEDLFKFCEYEFCKKNNLIHVSDLGYGKGYDISRNEFFIEISKLLAVEKNIILIMHGQTITCKDRRGVEYTKYVPSNRLPDKVLDQIEGRVRYFLRAFAVTEENVEGHLITKRYLSLSPDGTTEYGICRGLDETKVSRYIDLDWATFYNSIGLGNEGATVVAPRVSVETPKVVEQPKPTAKEVVETLLKKEEPKPIPVPVVEEPKIELPEEDELPFTEPVVETTIETPVAEAPRVVEEVKVEEPKVVEPTPAPIEAQSNEDKLAAIKAKLAAIKAGQK